MILRGRFIREVKMMKALGNLFSSFGSGRTPSIETQPLLGTDQSNRGVSVGSGTKGTEKTAQVWSTNKAYTPSLGRTIKEEETPLLGGDTSVASGEKLSPKPQASMKKAENCVKQFFQGLIQKFKASVDQYKVKQQHIHHREQISQNPHSAKLSQTLGKFLGKAKTETQKGSESELGEYTYESPKLTSTDMQNLNNYFSGDNIGPGLDALSDLYEAGNTKEFENILKALTPDNFAKVERQIPQTEDGGNFQLILERVRAEKDHNVSRDMKSAIEQLKSPETIDDGIAAIRDLALAGLPDNASEGYKEFAVNNAIANALSELFNDEDQIDTACQVIVEIAKSDPDQAGRVLHLADIPSSNADKVAKKVMEKLDSPEKRAKLVGGALKSEVQAHSKEQPGNLLRGNTIGSKLLAEFTKAHVVPHFTGSEKLQNALKKLPKENLLSEDSETKEKSISSENATRIQEHTTEVLSILEEIATDTENEELSVFYDMCRDVQQTVNDKFGKSSAETVPLNFLFLRGLNAAMLGKVTKFEGLQIKNAILVTKIIQNMVNKVDFDNKEEYMRVFGPFLTSGREPVETINQHLSGEEV